MDDEQIEEQIEGLRNGEELNRTSLAAIADAINREIGKIAKAWSLRFFIGAAEPIDREWTLTFSKHKDKWQFTVGRRGDTQEILLTSASLERRRQAIQLLPTLEEKLVESAKLKKHKLLEAFDKVSEFAENAAEKK